MEIVSIVVQTMITSAVIIIFLITTFGGDEDKEIILALSSVVITVVIFVIFYYRNSDMNEIIPVETTFEMTNNEHPFEIVPSVNALTLDDSIQVDSEKYQLDEMIEFFVMVGDVKSGTVRFDPGLSKYGVRWVANMTKEDDPGSCYGFGRNPGEAIQDAVTGGVHRLRETANNASKIGTQIKRNPKRVKLIPKHGQDK